MIRQLFLIVIFVCALTGVAVAESSLNTSVLQVGLEDDVVCFASNAGANDVTIRMEVYKDGILHGSSGSQVLQANKKFTIGVSGSFWWQCKIVVLKGGKNNVRGVMYGFAPTEVRPFVALEAQ